MLRRWLIWCHRYVGVPLSVLFVVWFASGFVMMYTGDMPRLTADARLAHLPPLDVAATRLTPAEAATRADVRHRPTRARLLTVLGRPAYRFDGVTVFADTGTRLRPIGPDAAREVAHQFSGTPPVEIVHLDLVDRPDQWTLVTREALPAHRFRLDDAAGTELYVAASTAEVAMVTTRRTRALAWLGAIPHWFYLPVLRIEREPWEQLIVWTSAVGCLVALTGLVLGVTQLRWRRRHARQSRIPYTGAMRWHYLTGAVFGLATLTWTFSGLLSVQPFAWMRTPELGVAPTALSGGRLALEDFPPFDQRAWTRATAGRSVKEVVLHRIDGAPYYEVRGSTTPTAAHDDPLVLAAGTLAPRDDTDQTERLVARLGAALPGVPIENAERLGAYDDYYYGRGADRPRLPVVRVRLLDPMQTWIYIDPALDRVVHSAHRHQRLERWLFNGLHSLDFAFWYDRRPWWDLGVGALMAGGLASSSLGLWIGGGRVRRAVDRGRRRRTPRSATR